MALAHVKLRPSAERIADGLQCRLPAWTQARRFFDTLLTGRIVEDMARKMVVLREDGTSPVLTEQTAEDEGQLQELMKDNADLLPIDEFGITGPLMVVGRETALPSGAVDLLALARSGELLVIEFKTGPQNSDFRRVLAQLLDYGSDLWRMTYEVFEATVARRYFDDRDCKDPRVRGKATIEEAARATWTDVSDEDLASLKDRLSDSLARGAFHYLVVAQRSTSTTERTVEYLNAVATGARFYIVELVRFVGDGLSAFESRTLLKPSSDGGIARAATDEARFVEAIEDEGYRAAVKELLEVCRGLGLRFEWGTRGTSIRLATSDRAEPISVGWLFPPGVSGWLGLRDLTLGFDTASGVQVPSALPALEQYVSQVGALPGALRAKAKGLRAFALGPHEVVRSRREIAESLADLVEKVRGNA